MRLEWIDYLARTWQRSSRRIRYLSAEARPPDSCQGPLVGPGIGTGPDGVTTGLISGAGAGAGSEGDLNTTMNKKTNTTKPRAARNATKSPVTLAVRF
jgi:hypothetical protein